LPPFPFFSIYPFARPLNLFGCVIKQAAQPNGSESDQNSGPKDYLLSATALVYQSQIAGQVNEATGTRKCLQHVQIF
jgi:hypothetical protein